MHTVGEWNLNLGIVNGAVSYLYRECSVPWVFGVAIDWYRRLVPDLLP